MCEREQGDKAKAKARQGKARQGKATSVHSMATWPLPACLSDADLWGASRTIESGVGQNLVPERAVVTDHASRCYGVCAIPDWTTGLLPVPAPTQLGGAGGAACGEPVRRSLKTARTGGLGPAARHVERAQLG